MKKIITKSAFKRFSLYLLILNLFSTEVLAQCSTACQLFGNWKIAAITSPVSGCNKSASETISFTFQQQGNVTLGSTRVELYIDGVFLNFINIANNLLTCPNSATQSFPGTYSFVPRATPYKLHVRINNSNDGLACDDTLTVFIKSDFNTVGGNVSGATICTGSSTSLTLAGQTGTVQKWQSSTDPFFVSPAPTDILSTSTTLNTGVLTQTTYFRADVKSGACSNVLSSAGTVTVHQNISNNSISSDQTICRNSSPANIIGTTPANGNGAYTYVWYKSTTSGAWPGDFVAVAGATAIDLTTAGPLTTTTWFRREVISGPCLNSISLPVQITVTPDLSGNTVTSAQTICTGSTPVALDGGTPAGGDGTYTYQWESSTVSAVAGFGNASGSSINENYSPGALTQTTWYRRILRDGLCADQTSGAVQITVEQNIANNTIASAQTICTGSTPAVLVGSNPTGGNGTYTYTWERSTSGPLIGYAPIGVATRDHSPGALTQNTWYIRRVTSGVCSSSTSAEIAITVNNNISNNTISAAQTICTGSVPAALNGLLPAGGNGSYTYTWESSTTSAISGFSPASGVNTNQNYSPAALTQTTWFRRVVASPPCVANTSTAIQITVNANVANNTLSANQIICNSETPATITGNLPTGGNGTFSYQWESSTTSPGIAGYSDIIGATAINYSPGPLTQNTWYRRKVISGACATAGSPHISGAHQITVNPVIANNSITTADQTVCETIAPSNLNASFPVGGDGSYTYLWESSTTSAVAGFSAAAGTNSTQNYIPGTLTETTWFRRVVMSASCVPLASAAVKVTVDKLPVAGNVDPVDQIVCATANNGTLNLAGYLGDVYRWQRSTDGGLNWSDIGVTTNSYTFTNLAGPATYQYRVGVKNGVCVNEFFSASATVAVQNQTDAGEVSNATVCSGSSGTITLSGHNGSIVRWERSINGTTWEIFGGTGSSESYTNISQATQYRVYVNDGLCPGTNSKIGVVNVDQPSFGGDASHPSPVCAGSNTSSIVLGTHTGAILDWEYSLDGSTWSSTSVTSNPIIVTNLSATRQYRALVKNGVCPTSISDTTIVTVNPVSVGGSVTGGGQLCSGSNATLTLASHTGTLTDWEYSTDNGSNWTSSGNNSNPYSLLNITSSIYYRAKVKSGVCASTNSNIAIISVTQPSIGGVIAGGGASICSGANNGTLTLNSFNGSIVDWEVSSDGGVAWTSLFNTSSAYNYSNLTTAVPVTHIYRAIVKSGACAPALSSTATLNLTPATVGGALAGSGTVCSGSNSGMISLSGHTGDILRWERSPDDGASWVVFANSTTSFPYTNINQRYHYRAVIQSPGCSMLYSTTAIVDVSNATSGGITNPLSPVVCDGSAATIYLSNQVGTVVNWQYSVDGGSTWSTIANTSPTLTYAVTGPTRFYANVQSCSPAVSSTTIINVDAPSVAGTLSGNAAHCSGANSGVLSHSGSITGTIVRWESSVDNGVSWSTINHTNPAHSYSNLGVSTKFRVVVQNGVCDPAYSNEASVIVAPITIKGIITGPASVCSGSNGTVTIVGQVGNILQWEYSTDNGVTWVIDNTNTTNTFNFTNLTVDTKYRALLQGCTQEYTDIQTVLALPDALGGDLSGSAVICKGANSGVLNLSNNAGTTIKWEFSIDGGNTWVELSNNGNSFTYNNVAQDTRYRVLSISGGCSQAYSNEALLTIPLAAYVNYVAGDATVCSVNNGGVISLIDYNGTIEQWEASVDSGLTWDTIPNNAPFLSYNNLLETTIYRAKLKVGNCSAVTSPDITIKVNEKPQADFVVPPLKAEESASFSDNSSILNGSINFQFWNFGDGATETGTNPSHTYATPGNYTIMLMVISDAGCMDSSIVDVEVQRADKFQVTNLLTLNENGQNDTWYVENIEAYPESEVHVYNRFGSEIYSAKPYKNDWNGTYRGNALPDGTYYYILKLSPNGKKYNGTITIVK